MTARIVYSDLDGTMVGPGGNFFAAMDHSPTDAPARALLDLHRAGVPLVLVSGRTRNQLVEAAGIFGADGFVAELGALVGWNGYRDSAVLTGAMPPSYGDELPLKVMVDAGLPEKLFARYPGRLQWHAPWHATHEADAMLRGRIDVAEAEAWLAGQGYGWLRLRDNGVVSWRKGFPGLDEEALPPHVYHLMPDGLSKGAAVAWDLARRGLDPADAVAIGDSVSDLTMAPSVGTMFVVANGVHSPAVPPALASLRAEGHDVRVTAGEVGLGWAEAVRIALGARDPG